MIKSSLLKLRHQYQKKKIKIVLPIKYYHMNKIADTNVLFDFHHIKLSEKSQA